MKMLCSPPNALSTALRLFGAGSCLAFVLPLVSGQAVPAAPPPTDQTTQKAPTDEEIQKLPSFEVSADQDRGYLAANSVSATRINTPIKDLPFAMSAFTQQFMADTAARSLNDVADYAAGVKVAGVEFWQGDSSVNVRGFRQYPQVDGVFGSVDANLYVDVTATERVEVVKGPASLLYGQILPGGTVNIITKRANSTPSTTVTVSGGSMDYGRVSVDTNQPLVKDVLLFRFNGSWENDFQMADPGKSRVTVLDPTVTWNIAKNMSLRVNYQWFQKDETPQQAYLPASEICTPESVVSSMNPANGYPNLNDPLGGNIPLTMSKYGTIDAVPDRNGQTSVDYSDPGTQIATFLYPKNFNYAGANDHRLTDLGTLNAELDTTIGEHWTTQANFNYISHSARFQQTGYGGLWTPPANSLVYSNGAWSVAPAWAAMNDTQRLQAYANWVTVLNDDPHAALTHEMQNGTPSPFMFSRRPRLTEDFGHTQTFQYQAAGQYKFGDWMTIKPLVGYYENEGYSTYYQVQAFGNASDPWFHPWDINPASPTYYINHNENTSTAQMFRKAGYNLTHTGDEAVYGVLNGSFFHDRVFVIGGARYNTSMSNATDYLAGDAADAYGTGIKSHYTTPQVGVGWKITKDTMLYADYSTSFTIPSVPNLKTLGYDSHGNQISVIYAEAKPTTGTGKEVGFKTDFFNGRISSTLSVYDDEQQNVVNSTTLISSTGLSYSIDTQGETIRSTGVEYEITYSPLDNLQVFASATAGHCAIVAEPPGQAYYVGEWALDYSRKLASLWARYTVPTGAAKGAWIGAGFKSVSKAQSLDSGNKFEFDPSYFELNSAFGYDWIWDHRKMSVVVNWTNMLNKMVLPAEQMRPLGARAICTVTCSF